ncbi:uncharacterized protein N7511_000120 [Penicillium nucicola]|uniref:uncharacterized protein n=1 Tax=Penicillium nucicola TaxID=1850975 RepID=UPI0025452F0B|nr:uncharacterized protein N7511_000120 [Penicillium nucicola]KAJ5775109.1 hypothetical protein N7511_000120 [Penicillium nucicola]
MSRTIDRLPMPTVVQRKKVIVLSHSRSGTLGLYRALQILGFTPYHVYECFIVNGTDHTKIFTEAAIAQNNPHSGIKKLTRADCDKWWANYDAVVEVTSLLSTEVLESYAQDPDVKFILTERDPKKWALSINNSGGKAFMAVSSFPLNILKYFDYQLYHFIEAHLVAYNGMGSGTRPGDPDNEAMLCQYYTDYIQKIKSTIPEDRRCTIQLDTDGLEWEDICTYLELPVPKQDYPSRNQPAEFQALFEAFLMPRLAAAAIKCGAVAVPVLGVLGWASVKYGPSTLVALNRYFSG